MYEAAESRVLPRNLPPSPREGHPSSAATLNDCKPIPRVPSSSHSTRNHRLLFWTPVHVIGFLSYWAFALYRGGSFQRFLCFAPFDWFVKSFSFFCSLKPLVGGRTVICRQV
ncbi:hypothetical protein V6N13_020495 [Hibiscus sabdariffa]